MVPLNGLQTGAVAATPWGSSSILTITWAYIRLMGGQGLREASQVSILNANYMAKRLEEGGYRVVYKDEQGLNAHEFIVDCKPFKKTAGVEVNDIAKRLMDYGFHAPTMAWPVHDCLMIEPTESEDKAEMDRFIESMLEIRAEIAKIEEGVYERDLNPLKVGVSKHNTSSSRRWHRTRCAAWWPPTGSGRTAARKRPSRSPGVCTSSGPAWRGSTTSSATATWCAAALRWIRTRAR